MRHRSSFLPGFSLLETLIAVGLIGVLIGTIGLFVNQIAGSRTQLRASTSRDALATAIFDGLETALMTAIARTGSGSPGIIGTSRGLSVAHDGVVVSRVFGDIPQAVFAPESTLLFEFDESSGEARLRRDDSSSPVSETALGAVRFRYLSNGAWSSSWNSFDSGGLPAAIECSIWWISPFEDETSLDDFEPDLLDSNADAFGDEPGDESVDATGGDMPSNPPDRIRLMRVPDGGVFETDDDPGSNTEARPSFPDDSIPGGDG